MITVITAAYKRPIRFRLFLKNYTNLIPKPQIVVAGSPEDPETEALAREFGCHYISSPNSPLGAKWNDAVEYACKNLIQSHILIEGSDDYIDQKMWAYMNDFQGDYLGLRDFYLYDSQRRQYIRWKGYKDGRRLNEPLGSGKLINTNFLIDCNFRPHEDSRQRGLDFKVHENVMTAGAKLTLVNQSETGGINIGIKDPEKDGTNLNKMPAGGWSNSEYIHFRHIQANHPDIWALIQQYK